MTVAIAASQSAAATAAAPVLKRIGVVFWQPNEGMAQAIGEALSQLGYAVVPFNWHQPVPAGVEAIFSHGPYGRFLSVPAQLGQLPPSQRPLLAHWNDEGMPDLRLPWPVLSGVGRLRSWIGRQLHAPHPNALARLPALKWFEPRLMRFSYLGDYRFAYQQGWLSLLVDQSKIYAALRSAHGLPTLAVPWGAIPAWSADLGLERDIDVLWLGARASRRRGALLDQVRADLRQRGIEIYVADNEEHPFIFGEERTRMLNRAKVTLNLTRTWYDDNFLRFSIVLPNRSLLVSEPMLAHCDEYIAGTHYVTAPAARLGETIAHYLAHPAERQRIVDSAYELVTQTLTLKNCVARIMAALNDLARARQTITANPH
jgi:hypothetical protein